MTSIDPGRLHGDLADRLLVVELDRIGEDDRKADQRVSDQWQRAHPAVLGGLLDLTAEVLAVLPAVRTGNLPRMADFARILLAVDKVLGTSGYDRYAEQASQIAEQVADADSVALAIRGRVTAAWAGTASDLLTKLAPVQQPPKDWPSTPQGMGGRLARAAPALRALGWIVEPPDRTRNPRYRQWTLTPPGEQEQERETMEQTERQSADLEQLDSMVPHVPSAGPSVPSVPSVQAPVNNEVAVCIACDRPARRGCRTCWDHASQEDSR
jgi:hypothetical protein